MATFQDKKQNIIRQIFGTNIKTLILSFCAAAVGIFLNFFLAKIFNSESFGNIQYYVSLASTISSFLIFGFVGITVREAKNPDYKINIVNKVFTLFFVICVFFAPIIFFVCERYLIFSEKRFLVSFIVLLVSIVMGIISIGSGYFQGVGEYHKSIIVENLFPKLSMLILAIIFFIISKLSFFENFYIYFYLIIYSVPSVFILKKQFKKINLQFSKSEVSTMFAFFGSTITFSLTANLTKVFQKAFFSNASSLAIISISLSIISLLSVFTSVFLNIVKPIFAKQKREENFDGIVDTFRLTSRVSSYVAIPFFLFLLTQGDKFLSFFGESYLLYPKIIVILSIKALVSEITGPTGTMLLMVGKEKYEFLNGVVNLASFVIFAFVFKNDSIYGMCLALMLSSAIVNIMRFIEVWIFFKKPPYDFKTVITFLICAGTNFVCIFFLKYINNFVIWLISGLFVGISCIVLNFIFSLYKNDFRTVKNIKL